MVRQTRVSNANMMTLPEKLGRFSWGLFVPMCIVLTISIVILYSAGGGHWRPYALSQLMKMPIDYLKLDKSFIDNCTIDDEENKTDKFIANVIRIAKDINCKVVAEGVETKEQRDTLLKAGCDIIQGFYYAKPMPISEYEELLKKDT